MNEDFDCATCDKCGCELEWVDCGTCGGDGFIDGEELISEDPLWYDEDDVEECRDCGGHGGVYVCEICDE